MYRSPGEGETRDLRRQEVGWDSVTSNGTVTRDRDIPPLSDEWPEVLRV